MYIGLHVIYPLLLSYFNDTRIFSQQSFEKNTQILNFIKIHHVEAELFHADRRTVGHYEANSRISQFRERA